MVTHHRFAIWDAADDNVYSKWMEPSAFEYSNRGRRDIHQHKKSVRFQNA